MILLKIIFEFTLNSYWSLACGSLHYPLPLHWIAWTEGCTHTSALVNKCIGFVPKKVKKRKTYQKGSAFKLKRLITGSCQTPNSSSPTLTLKCGS